MVRRLRSLCDSPFERPRPTPTHHQALQTGQFAWEFQRAQTSPTDWIVALVVIALAFVGMAFYWALPVLRGAQTVGQCILGIQVVPSNTAPLSVKRVWLRGFGQPFAPVLWLVKLVSGKYWPDVAANTKVVRVLTHSSAAA